MKGNTMSLFYVTPEHHIDIEQVKVYNRKQTVWHMKFMIEGEPRQRGWVVSVANKNGVCICQRYCQNKEEAIAFAEIKYGIVR